MIHEAGIEYCVVAEYADGYSYCMAKFMHEEDARCYNYDKVDNEYRKWKVYRRTEKHRGEVTWEEL